MTVSVIIAEQGDWTVNPLVPAQAGTQGWIPAYAGMSGERTHLWSGQLVAQPGLLQERIRHVAEAAHVFDETRE